MLERIKKMVLASYDSKQSKWVFFSVFGKDGLLLLSNGVIQSDKTLENTIDTIYHGLVEKQEKLVGKVIVDIVIDVKQETDMKKIMDTSLEKNGLFITAVEGNKSWLLLPNTSWVTDIKSALAVLQKKNAIEWNVLIHIFQTERFEIV